MERNISQSDLRGRKTVGLPFLLAGLIFVALLMFVLFALLPNMLSQPALDDKQLASPNVPAAPQAPGEPATTQTELPVAVTTEVVRTPMGDRETTEAIMASFLKLDESLQARSVQRWASESYQQAASAAKRGDEFFAAQRYDLAADQFRQALSQLEQIKEGMSGALRDSIVNGKQALVAHDKPAAVDAFEVALAIDPQSEEATQGYASAQVLEEVVKHLEQGQLFENSGNPALALLEYQAALQLDEHSGEAAEALRRMSALLSGSRFSVLMSQALAALGRGDYQQSLDTFKLAHEIDPDNEEVMDGIRQAKEGLRNQKIAGYRASAEKAMKTEQWSKAALNYQKALNIDPTLSFARNGKVRAIRLETMVKEMNYLLSVPDRLTTSEAQERATSLLAEAKASSTAGPVFAANTRRFEEALKQAGTPARVVLTSDELTSVDVYKVGRFGVFSRKELELKPGTYTVVGARVGFKDVRLTLKINLGQQQADLAVICTEAI